MKILLFLLFISLCYISFSFSFLIKANIKLLKLTSINYVTLDKKGKNLINNHVHRKNIRSLKSFLYPHFLKRIIEPLENANFKNYFFFRSLSRICVSLSSAFSLNAKLNLYRKNTNNLLLTQLLMNNEILIKILKICWLYKLSHFIDKNIKLCRYMSTIFYIISIYLDILSTYNISKNFYFYYFLYSLSSILKNLSILTYTSIRSSINFHVSQMLSNSNQKFNEKSIRDIKLVNKDTYDKNISNENINDENKDKNKNDENVDKNKNDENVDKNKNDENEDKNINDENKDKNINEENVDKNINDENEDKNINDENKDKNINEENVDKNINDENKDKNINDENEDKNIDEKLMEVNTLKKEYNILKKVYEKKKENNNSNILRNNLKVKRKFYIGEISVITDLLFSLVDLSTILLLSHAAKFIKQKIFFYIFLSSLHLFFSYKELEYLLI
ncbi:conserved Plasmodium membrane protein, unknown function [Plasmodium gallinaceum]|uniref:Protein root UVB sensitive/RUS domain-containing protein n=1 Tax=Plasmodium gallinaceum TaxID=5849 RepID=A0A1J1GN91_PLAGA|nr:conserved Plasmodium membrane protein, unknown function [Plasmodium gallinaceum]CRG93803.1 conserved Plasmodium membrane protein, unknown function [Plasmodium gallinaceum]